MSDPARLTLVRHGETRANLERVWHGSTDAPLTARGLAQAERVSYFLGQRGAGAAALYASQLLRARATAEAIGARLALPVRIDPELAEFHLGSWEGQTYQALFQEFRLFERMKEDPDFAAHGGESPRQVTERVAAALRRIAAGHPGERVIVVVHGGALALVLAQLLDGDYREWRGVMDNGGVSELVLEPRPRLLSFNRVDHLAGL